MSKILNWKVSAEDHRLIEEIAKRGAALGIKGGPLIMDLTAVHANGNPLRLLDLLRADDFNFAHDVEGIAFHIDRKTGELKNFFVPRFSVREAEAGGVAS